MRECMQTTKTVMVILVIGVLSAGCKSERQKEMSAWAERVCACKDKECASEAFLKGEKFVDRAGWDDADSAARDVEWAKAEACDKKLEKK